MELELIIITVLSFMVIFTAVFWLLILFEGKDSRDPKPKKFPPVTIIIPAFNEEEIISKCIQSVLDLNYPGKKYILVVNDGSIDKTAEKVKKFLKKGVELLNKKNSGKADSLNQALKKVNTPFYVCLDADSIVSKNALMHMMGYFENKNVAAVTPAMKVFKPKKFVEKVQWVEYLTSVLVRKLSSWIDVIIVTPGPFSVYRTAVIKKLGCYDTKTLTEDMEITYRLHNAGYSVENSVHAEVFTYAPKNLHELLKQRMRWMRGSYQNLFKYSHMLLNRKYGTFGVVMLPITVAALLLAPLAVGFSLYLLYQFVTTLISNIHTALVYGIFFDISWFYTTPFGINAYYFVIAISVLSLGLSVLWLSHRFSKEKVSFNMKLVYFAYILIYFVFLNVVWILSFFEEVLGVGRKW